MKAVFILLFFKNIIIIQQAIIKFVLSIFIPYPTAALLAQVRRLNHGQANFYIHARI